MKYGNFIEVAFDSSNYLKLELMQVLKHLSVVVTNTILKRNTIKFRNHGLDHQTTYGIRLSPVRVTATKTIQFP